VSGRQAIGGCALACAIMFVDVFIGISVAIRSGGWVIALCILLGAGSITAIAMKVQRNPSRRGLAIGLWIGLGVSLLLTGICFIGALS
jgi:hypothetical protein